jgi:hypothetical protein
MASGFIRQGKVRYTMGGLQLIIEKPKPKVITLIVMLA